MGATLMEMDFLPQPTYGKAPAEPQSYSDGALINVHLPYASIGTMRVWHRGRSQATHPLTLNEGACNWGTSQVDGGFAIHSHLFGFAISSTRTEAAALLITVQAPMPVHVGMDNKAVVDTYNALWHRSLNLWRRPWALRNDGDI